MKVLVGCWPAYGHLLPMLPMIRAAQRAGHEVVVSSGPDLAPVLEGLGVPAHRSGVTLAESYQRLPDSTTISKLPPEEQAGFAATYLFGAGAVDRARDLAGFVDEWQPDLVLHDTLELGAATVAAVSRWDSTTAPAVMATRPAIVPRLSRLDSNRRASGERSRA